MQVFWVGMGSLSSFALGIVSAAILSRYLEKVEYGTYRQILYVYNTLLVIFSAGLPRVFSYFLPRYPLEQGKHIVWKVSKMLFFFGMAFSIVLYAFSEIIAQILRNPELATGLKYFSPIPMLLLPTLGIEGIFSTYKKTIYIAIYNTATRFLMLIFIVLPVIIYKGSYIYAIFGWSIASIIALLLAIYFKGLPFKGIETETSNLSYNAVFSYSLPLVVASIAGIAIKAADQFYISRFFGAEVFAEFSNGFIGLPFVGMVTGATSMVFMHLRRGGVDVEYLNTKDGREVDFFTRDRISGETQLIQVCWEMSDKKTFARELHGLKSAMDELSLQTGTIVTWDDETVIENKIKIIPVWKWLLT